MKKILSVLCVLAFIASFACIGASAADPAATFSIVAANPEVGATTFTADVVATLPEGGDVTQLGLLVTVPEDLKLVSCDQAVSFGSFVTSETVDTNPYMILWVSGTKSLDAGDTAIATMTFELPADAAVDSAYEIVLELEPDNLPASVAGEEYAAEDIAVVGATVTVVEAPIVTTTETDEPTPSESEEPTPSESEEPTPSESEEPTPSESEEPTPSESDKPQAPQTGDNATMMYVVVAVMVVALGAAVVVKKVNVK